MLARTKDWILVVVSKHAMLMDLNLRLKIISLGSEEFITDAFHIHKTAKIQYSFFLLQICTQTRVGELHLLSISQPPINYTFHINYIENWGRAMTNTSTLSHFPVSHFCSRLSRNIEVIGWVLKVLDWSDNYNLYSSFYLFWEVKIKRYT